MKEDEISLEIGDIVSKIEISPTVDYPFGSTITECHVLGLDTREHVWLEYLDEKEIKRSKLFSLKTLVVLAEQPAEERITKFHVVVSTENSSRLALANALTNADYGVISIKSDSEQIEQNRSNRAGNVFSEDYVNSNRGQTGNVSSEAYGNGNKGYKDTTNAEKQCLKNLQFSSMMERINNKTDKESEKLVFYKLLYSMVKKPDDPVIAKKGDFVWQNGDFCGTVNSVLDPEFSEEGPTLVVDHGTNINCHLGYSLVLVSDIEHKKLTKPPVG
jgi:hypothetical protein